LYDIDQIQKAVDWRDLKLLSLARHKNEEKKDIDLLFPTKNNNGNNNT
jgi:hypothetical protein